MDTIVEIKLPAEIEDLKLDKIKWKLMEAEEPENRWTSQQAEIAEREYKRFLTLIKMYPKQDIVPTKIIDKFWHQHILDTVAYAKDCNTIFGYFLHHYPYFGMHGKQDQQDLVSAFEVTQRMYADAFGEAMTDQDFARCKDHSCHAPSSCACRTPGACKNG